VGILATVASPFFLGTPTPFLLSADTAPNDLGRSRATSVGSAIAIQEIGRGAARTAV